MCIRDRCILYMCVCVCACVHVHVCVCVCVCVHAQSKVSIFGHTYFRTAEFPNEGNNYIYYCTIVSPLPTSFWILSMSLRRCCIWMLQVPEHTIWNINFWAGVWSNFCPVNVLTMHIFSTKLEIQIGLTLLYLDSNFGEWCMYHLWRDVKILLGVCVSIFKHQL